MLTNSPERSEFLRQHEQEYKSSVDAPAPGVDVQGGYGGGGYNDRRNDRDRGYGHRDDWDMRDDRYGCYGGRNNPNAEGMTLGRGSLVEEFRNPYGKFRQCKRLKGRR